MSRFGRPDTFSLRSRVSEGLGTPSFTAKYNSLQEEIANNAALKEAWRKASEKSKDVNVIAKYAYTYENGDSSFYRDLNIQLRKAYEKGGICKFPYYHYVLLLNKQTIKKTVTLTLYRGERVTTTDFGGVGKQVIPDQYESCSLDKEVAEQFLKSGFFVAKQGTLFTIKTNKVIEILTDSFYPSEREYLIPHGVDFKITAIRKKSGYQELDLEVL